MLGLFPKQQVTNGLEETAEETEPTPLVRAELCGADDAAELIVPTQEHPKNPDRVQTWPDGQLPAQVKSPPQGVPDEADPTPLVCDPTLLTLCWELELCWAGTQAPLRHCPGHS